MEKRTKERLKKKARSLIREWSKPTRNNHYNKGWLGVAPSHLCTELDVDYDEAAAILKDLEEEGFIYDNGNGNQHEMPDGRTCATRFYISAGG